MSTVVVDHRLAEAVPTPFGLLAAPGFEAFYVANERRLYRALFVVTGDRDETEDIMQTAFCKMWERWDKVARLDDPVGYLFRTAFNTHRSATRRSMRAALRFVGLSSAEESPPEPSEVAATRDHAARALDVLTRRQREAVVLTALLGFGTAEAAQVMGIRPATVRVLVSQARAALADHVGLEE